MKKPELVLIAGCNAAGKSTFIRTRLNELEGFEILMTDVYKGRTKELARQAIGQGKDILIETVFNDESFKDLADQARHAGYQTSLVVLFLDSIQQSVNRVAFRGMQASRSSTSTTRMRIPRIQGLPPHCKASVVIRSFQLLLYKNTSYCNTRANICNNQNQGNPLILQTAQPS